MIRILPLNSMWRSLLCSLLGRLLRCSGFWRSIESRFLLQRAAASLAAVVAGGDCGGTHLGRGGRRSRRTGPDPVHTRPVSSWRGECRSGPFSAPSSMNRWEAAAGSSGISGGGGPAAAARRTLQAGPRAYLCHRAFFKSVDGGSRRCWKSSPALSGKGDRINARWARMPQSTLTWLRLA